MKCPFCSSTNNTLVHLTGTKERRILCNKCSIEYDAAALEPVNRVKNHLGVMDKHMQDHVDLGRMIDPRTLWHQMNPLMDAIQADSCCDMPWVLLHFSKKLYSGRTPLRPRQAMNWWLMATTDLRKD